METALKINYPANNRNKPGSMETALKIHYPTNNRNKPGSMKIFTDLMREVTGIGKLLTNQLNGGLL